MGNFMSDLQSRKKCKKKAEEKGIRRTSDERKLLGKSRQNNVLRKNGKKKRKEMLQVDKQTKTAL